LCHRFWYLLCQLICQFTFILAWKLRVFGKRNIPGEGPVLFVSNHQSLLDPVLIGVGQKREVHYLARDTLFSHALFRRLIVSLNALPVKREDADHVAFRRAIEVLKKDRQLLIFPEGTRTQDGSLGGIHPGWALLAARSQATIVPAIIEGAHDAWPRAVKLPRPGHILVAFGQGFKLARTKRSEVTEATNRIEKEWVKLQTMLRKRLYLA